MFDELEPLSSRTASHREWEEGVAARLDVIAGMLAALGDQLARARADLERLAPLAEAMEQLGPVFAGLKPEANGGKPPTMLQIVAALTGRGR